MVVTTSLCGGDRTTVERVHDLGRVIGDFESGELAAVGIDIPIGLPEVGPRRCDLEARRMIGARRSSVFPAPMRGLLGAATYDEAVSRAVALSGKGLSRQAFGSCPRSNRSTSWWRRSSSTA